jgi:hypothetical protein
MVRYPPETNLYEKHTGLYDNVPTTAELTAMIIETEKSHQEEFK